MATETWNIRYAILAVGVEILLLLLYYKKKVLLIIQVIFFVIKSTVCIKTSLEIYKF